MKTLYVRHGFDRSDAPGDPTGERRPYARHDRPSGMDDQSRVDWRPWGEAAFVEAERSDRPLLLSLTATWCDHCHEMDRETYAVESIARTIDERFVPVRVDVDRRPRVRDRYNMGGFPSTVFLSPDGSLLTGAGYLGPDGMEQVVERVGTMWDEEGREAGRIPRALAGEEPPSGELSEAIETGMLVALTDAYDEVVGGWGDGPKFPLPEALEFALARDRSMATRSLDAVSANLLDDHEGGFHRFAGEPDWSGLRHEKLLDTNAALVRAFSNAYLATGREEYRLPAERTIEYLTTTLWTGDAFAASQAPGDPEAYTAAATDREAATEPPVDRTVLAGPNALAVEALLTYGAYTDDERARQYAERALDTIRESLLDGGEVVRYREPTRKGGHDGGEADPPPWRTDTESPRLLLADQARVCRALLAARSVLGSDTVAPAREVADRTIEALREGESFLDGPREGEGLLDRPLRPLEGNVWMADACLDLATLAGDDRYREVARETLSAFAGASDRLGPEAAGYAAAVARLTGDRLVIRVGTDAGSDLHRAAFRLADHEKLVVPRADVESDTAVVEYGDRVAEPATTPAELESRVSALFE